MRELRPLVVAADLMRSQVTPIVPEDSLFCGCCTASCAAPNRPPRRTRKRDKTWRFPDAIVHMQHWAFLCSVHVRALGLGLAGGMRQATSPGNERARYSGACLSFFSPAVGPAGPPRSRTRRCPPPTSCSDCCAKIVAIHARLESDVASERPVSNRSNRGTCWQPTFARLREWTTTWPIPNGVAPTSNCCALRLPRTATG